MLAFESSKMTPMRSNPHQIFKAINVDLHEQNNSPLCTPVKITKEMKLQSGCFVLIQEHCRFSTNANKFNANIQYQPKIKEAYLGVLKQEKTRKRNFSGKLQIVDTRNRRRQQDGNS